jgi:hypothetical protein
MSQKILVQKYTGTIFEKNCRNKIFSNIRKIYSASWVRYEDWRDKGVRAKQREWWPWF